MAPDWTYKLVCPDSLCIDYFLLLAWSLYVPCGRTVSSSHFGADGPSGFFILGSLGKLDLSQ